MIDIYYGALKWNRTFLPIWVKLIPLLDRQSKITMYLKNSEYSHKNLITSLAVPLITAAMTQ